MRQSRPVASANSYFSMWLAAAATLLLAAGHAPSRAMVPNINPELDGQRPPSWNSSVARENGAASGDGPPPLTRDVADLLSIGYYSFSWTGAGGPPPGTTIGIAFSGWSTVDKALQAGPPAGSLAGTAKYLSLGGGNKNGVLSVDMLNSFGSHTPSIRGAGFNGVCFDVEESSAAMIPAMQHAFAACKAAGLRVLVTTSHSAPVRGSSQGAIVASWVANTDIDILSPQLYTTGREHSPNFATSGGVPWSSWRGAHAVILPSLVDGSHYAATKAFFHSGGISIGGYLRWHGG